MKVHKILKVVFILFTPVTCTLTEKLNTNWCKNSLQSLKGKERFVEYDFMISMIFISKYNVTASFSPLYSDYSILSRSVNGDFGSEYIEKGKSDLRAVRRSLRDDKYLLNNMNDENNTISREKNEGNTQKMRLKEHVKEPQTKDTEAFFEEILNPLWTSSNMEIDDESTEGQCEINIHFDLDWSDQYDKSCSYHRNFTSSEGENIRRTYMRSRNYSLYTKIEYDDIEFHLLALPFKKYDAEKCSYFMVYLIPTCNKVSLAEIWDAFYSYSKGEIKATISKLEKHNVLIDLPLLLNLKSEFNMTSLINDIFNFALEDQVESKMITYLNVDEIGAKAMAEMSTYSKDEDSSNFDVKHISADVPHISFIFSMKSQRILFITKDHGTIKDTDF